jgi:hypothetical protein
VVGDFETPDSGYESTDLGLSATPFFSESSKSLAIKSGQFDQHVIVLDGIAMLLDRFSELREIRLGVVVSYGSEAVGDDVPVSVVSVAASSDHLGLARRLRGNRDGIYDWGGSRLLSRSGGKKRQSEG